MLRNGELENRVTSSIIISMIVMTYSIVALACLQFEDANAQSYSTREVRIEPFNLRAGETQTHDMNISFLGPAEITVTRISFDNDTQGWLKVGMELPHTFKAKPATGNNVTAILPITATIPANYTSAGAQITTSVQVDYRAGETASIHTETFPIVVNVDNSPILTGYIIVGIVVAAVGIGLGVRRWRQNRGYRPYS
ncbi:MAG: hypothetical protein HMLIMOIP_002624 [Candidatus Nitrosomirales archaeon]|jgi:hypothetical protein